LEDLHYHVAHQAIKLHQQDQRALPQEKKLTSLLLSREKRVVFYTTTILPWAILLMLLLVSISTALFLLSFGLK